ncbi:MAG: hypothetical protein AB2421_12315 [Thermotaleaceae bacterium]
MENNEIKNQRVTFQKRVTILLALSLGINTVLLFNVYSMKNEINNLQNNIYGINTSINNTISSNINQIDQMLKKEASLITEFRYDFGRYEDKKVDVLMTLKPKSYTQGEKLYISYTIKDHSPQLLELQSQDGVTFSGTINMSIFEDMELDLVIDDGKTKKTEKLEGIYYLAEKFTANLNAHPIGGSMTYDKGKGAIVTTFEFELMHHRNKLDEQGGELRDVQLEIAVNDRVTAVQPMVKNDNSYGMERYTIQLKAYEIPCKTNDTVEIFITAKDDRGFSYRASVAGWTIGENGIDHTSRFFDYGKIEIQ